MITVAKTAGFCFGVGRAVEALENLAKSKDSVVTFGPIIHNPQVVEHFAQMGVGVIDSPDEAKRGQTVVIRSHGVALSQKRALEEKGAEVVDLTCPFVARIHGIVARESATGRSILIIGHRNHPEVIGIAGQTEGPVYIVTSPEEIYPGSPVLPCDPDTALSVVTQTTFDICQWNCNINLVKKYYTNLQIFDTICVATQKRQREAQILSQTCDLMIVVGSRNSSNTLRLKEVCERSCKTLLVETADELRKESFTGVCSVGVTAGASTPGLIIKEVKEAMSEIVNNDQFEDVNFEEALEQSLKSIYTGEKVVGTVIGFTPTEVQVDIGTKHAGYIPFSELTNDPTQNPQDVVKVGDQLELIAVRVNDIEGVVVLSKRKVDAIAGYEKVMNAAEDGSTLEGVVVDIVKGGVIAVTNGVKVFIPASLATYSRNDKLEDLLKKTVQFKILEVNRGRNRAVGSIKAAILETKKQLSEKFWETAEVGKEYTGKISSLTSYGAFVDLGGVDGMIHISELSWNRIRHPSEVVQVGDEVNVFIKELDPERKRVSLGYKKLSDNPWEILKNTYHVGDVAKVTIVSLTSFGAFANLIPGIDGLIHISQIANEHIKAPADVLKVGDVVDVKITDIDYDKKRVSLSIRALLNQESPAEETSEAQASEEE